MPVAQSAHVQQYEYDPATSSLRIEFVNGAIYEYANVPQAVADRFAQSGSKGSFLHAELIPRFGRGTVLRAAQKARESWGAGGAG